MLTLAKSSDLDWSQACDELAEELLDEAGWNARPVNAVRLAAALGYEVAIDANQPSRGRFKRLGGRPTVFLAPDVRPERLQWAAAHELGEAVACRLFDRLDIDPETCAPALRELAATTLATSILLPRRWFLSDAERLDGDVALLKSVYSTASHELILNGLLRLDTLTMVSVFDHDRLTRRRTNGRLPAPPLLALEKAAQSQAHRTGRGVSLEGRGVRVQAWPVHEPAWQRELVRTTATEAGDDVD